MLWSPHVVSILTEIGCGRGVGNQAEWEHIQSEYVFIFSVADYFNFI